MTYSTETTRETILDALNAVHGLTLLRDVLDDDAAQAMLTLLRLLSAHEPDVPAIAQAYSHTFSALAQVTNSSETMMPHLSDAWQAYLLSRIVDSIQPWSIQAERTFAPAAGLREQAKRDLHVLRLLYELSAQHIWQLTRDIVTQSIPSLHDAWVPWLNLAVTSETVETAHEAMMHHLAKMHDWTINIHFLEQYWARHGTGMFARYTVLRWQGRAEGLQ